MSVSRHFDDSGQMPFGHRGVHEEHTSFIQYIINKKLFVNQGLSNVCFVFCM